MPRNQAFAAGPVGRAPGGGLHALIGEKDGRVFYCTKGQEYWRFSTKDGDFYKPLNYSRKGIV